MSEIDRDELRRLLAEATPGPWVAEVSGTTGPVVMDAQSVSAFDHVAKCPHYRGSADSELIAAAANALPGLLDQLDAAEAALARVRELHTRESLWQYDRDQEYSHPTQQDAADESGCDCPYAAEPSADRAHTPECLATITHFDVCTECARIEYADADRQAHGEFSGYAEALWPCPTIRALDGGAES